MKSFLSSALLLASLSWASAQEVKPASTTPSPLPSTENVPLSIQELQIVGAALMNAGTACDANVKIYCQLAPLREPIVTKLQAALTKLQPPPTAPR